MLHSSSFCCKATLEDLANTCGQLTIGGHHRNRLRCIVIFLVILVYAHAICLYPIEKSNVPKSSAVTMEAKLEKSGFQEIAGFFSDLLTLKINIK